MYEQFKNDFILRLANNMNLTNNQLEEILYHLDSSSIGYQIQRKETQIVVYNQDIPHLVKTFIACKKVEGFSDKTLYNYTLHLKNLFDFVHKQPEQVTANDVRMYLYTYQQQRGISNGSLDKIRDVISSFYKWMYAEEYIDRNPMLSVKKIKSEKKQRTACSQIELEYLRKACQTLKQKAILEMLYSTGCRVGELVILKKSDIDWHEKTVHLFGKGKKHRVSFLNAKAEIALKEYLDSRNDDMEWLFVSDRKPHDQMHVCGIQRIIRGISNRANINKRISPHILRHTTACVLLDNNSDITSIQKILGHSNINTTMIYANKSLKAVKMDHLKSII